MLLHVCFELASICGASVEPRAARKRLARDRPSLIFASYVTSGMNIARCIQRARRPSPGSTRSRSTSCESLASQSRSSKPGRTHSTTRSMRRAARGPSSRPPTAIRWSSPTTSSRCTRAITRRSSGASSVRGIAGVQGRFARRSNCRWSRYIVDSDAGYTPSSARGGTSCFGETLWCSGLVKTAMIRACFGRESAFAGVPPKPDPLFLGTRSRHLGSTPSPCAPVPARAYECGVVAVFTSSPSARRHCSSSASKSAFTLEPRRQLGATQPRRRTEHAYFSSIDQVFWEGSLVRRHERKVTGIAEPSGGSPARSPTRAPIFRDSRDCCPSCARPSGFVRKRDRPRHRPSLFCPLIRARERRQLPCRSVPLSGRMRVRGGCRSGPEAYILPWSR